MGTWRGKDKQSLLTEIYIQKEQSLAMSDDKRNAIKAYDTHSAETRVLSLLTALGLGVVISALGVRVIQPFVDPDQFDELGRMQKALFSCADTFVSGAMLGGGSEGIHKILDTILTWFDKSRARLKNNP